MLTKELWMFSYTEAKIFNIIQSWLILALGRQEDVYKFKANQGYIVKTLCLKIMKVGYLI